MAAANGRALTQPTVNMPRVYTLSPLFKILRDQPTTKKSRAALNEAYFGDVFQVAVRALARLTEPAGAKPDQIKKLHHLIDELARLRRGEES